MINRAELLGHLGADPEKHTFENGDISVKFSLATTEKWTGKNGEKQELTSWHNIVMFGKVAEIADKYLTKGSKCYVSGKIRYREYEDADGKKKYTTEIIANELTLLDPKPA